MHTGIRALFHPDRSQLPLATTTFIPRRMRAKWQSKAQEQHHQQHDELDVFEHLISLDLDRAGSLLTPENVNDINDAGVTALHVAYVKLCECKLMV